MCVILFIFMKFHSVKSSPILCKEINTVLLGQSITFKLVFNLFGWIQLTDLFRWIQLTDAAFNYCVDRFISDGSILFFAVPSVTQTMPCYQRIGLQLLLKILAMSTMFLFYLYLHKILVCIIFHTPAESLALICCERLVELRVSRPLGIYSLELGFSCASKTCKCSQAVYVNDPHPSPCHSFMSFTVIPLSSHQLPIRSHIYTFLVQFSHDC